MTINDAIQPQVLVYPYADGVEHWVDVRVHLGDGLQIAWCEGPLVGQAGVPLVFEVDVPVEVGPKLAALTVLVTAERPTSKVALGHSRASVFARRDEAGAVELLTPSAAEQRAVVRDAQVDLVEDVGPGSEVQP